MSDVFDGRPLAELESLEVRLQTALIDARAKARAGVRTKSGAYSCKRDGSELRYRDTHESSLTSEFHAMACALKFHSHHDVTEIVRLLLDVYRGAK